MVAQRIPKWVTHMCHKYELSSPITGPASVGTSVAPVLLLFCTAALESRAKKGEISQGVVGAWMPQGPSHQQKSTVPSGLRHPQPHHLRGLCLAGTQPQLQGLLGICNLLCLSHHDISPRCATTWCGDVWPIPGCRISLRDALRACKEPGHPGQTRGWRRAILAGGESPAPANSNRAGSPRAGACSMAGHGNQVMKR